MKKVSFFIFIGLYFLIPLFSESPLETLVKFSFDSSLFGKVPSFFVGKNPITDRKWELFATDLHKNKDDYFFLIDEVNLIYKLDAGWRKKVEKSWWEKLNHTFSGDDFLLFYLNLLRTLYYEPENTEKLKALFDANIRKENPQKRILTAFWRAVILKDKNFLDKIVNESNYSSLSDHDLYAFGKIVLFYSHHPERVVEIWDLLLKRKLSKKKKAFSNADLILVLIDNLELYKKKKDSWSFPLAKFYWELKIILEPRNPINYNNLGFLLAEEGVDLEKALKYCKVAVTLDNKNPYYYDSLGWVYYRLGNYKEAISYLKTALNLKPDFYDALYHLGTVYYVIGEVNAAINYLQKAIDVASDKASPWNDLGYLLIDNDIDYKKGIEYVKKALSIEAENPFFLDSLGWGYFKVERLQEAEAVLRKSFSIRKLKDNFLHLAAVLFKLEKLGELRKFILENYSYQNWYPEISELLGILKAISMLEEKLAKDPKRKGFYYLMESNLYRRIGLYGKALILLDKAFAKHGKNPIVLRYQQLVNTHFLKIVEPYLKYYGLEDLGEVPFSLFFYWFLYFTDQHLFSYLNFMPLFEVQDNVRVFRGKGFLLVVGDKKSLELDIWKRISLLKWKERKIVAGNKTFTWENRGKYFMLLLESQKKVNLSFLDYPLFKALFFSNYFERKKKFTLALKDIVPAVEYVKLEKYYYNNGVWEFIFKVAPKETFKKETEKELYSVLEKYIKSFFVKNNCYVFFSKNDKDIQLKVKFDVKNLLFKKVFSWLKSVFLKETFPVLKEGKKDVKGEN